eukprot:TRINITY_DN15044_c0_g1_i2.p1 TRINITY_DN15044_c0_g1~~TRINITY_DN15044_c0_g1_i2.p1  ORF type:complete len:343 (+),score=65.74 TRINITY_DN15044_c0_g1_i2:350-1378(+)
MARPLLHCGGDERTPFSFEVLSFSFFCVSERHIHAMKTTRAVLASVAALCALTGGLAQQCHTPVIIGPLNVTDGQPKTAFLASGSKTITISDAGVVTVPHNNGAAIASECSSTFQPDMFYRLNLLGRTITFTTDLSRTTCACNAAFYLTLRPAHTPDQQPDPTKCGDYYCDANHSCGAWCPEIDIMEANKYAFQGTMHECDPPEGNYYTQCDRIGCGKNTYRTSPQAYGPGANYTIDTRAAFDVSASFVPNAQGQLAQVITELRQQGRAFRMVHDDTCGTGYLASLTEPLRQGFAITASYWGTNGSRMSWLDVPPCDKAVPCDEATQFGFSNIRVVDGVVAY